MVSHVKYEARQTNGINSEERNLVGGLGQAIAENARTRPCRTLLSQRAETRASVPAPVPT